MAAKECKKKNGQHYVPWIPTNKGQIDNKKFSRYIRKEYFKQDLKKKLPFVQFVNSLNFKHMPHVNLDQAKQDIIRKWHENIARKSKRPLVFRAPKK